MSSSRRGGGVSRRCECRGPDGKLLGKACPDAAKRSHGKLLVKQELPPYKDAEGREHRHYWRRAGYTRVGDAEGDLEKVRQILDLGDDDADALQRVTTLLLQVAKDRTPVPDVAEVKRKLGVGVTLDGKLTVDQWLTTWLAAKKTRKNTNRGYESHIRVHLRPHLGHLRLDKLNVGHLVEMFDAIADQNEVIRAENAARREQEARCTRGRPGAPKASEREALAGERAKLAKMPPFRRVTEAATRKSIRTTLRAALNAAIARQLITFNCAEHIEMTQAKRPKPVLWSDERVRRWRETGEKPSSVMVWTPKQVGVFLDAAEADRLYGLFCLIAFRGPRRGEAVGLDWPNVDLVAETFTVAVELIQDGWDVVESEPKTDGSAATIALGPAMAQVLREHRVRQLAEKEKAGEKWVETGKVFATELGEWLHPDSVTQTFKRIYLSVDLPPINLRDLRHVAATLIHAGGGDLHAIKETLRHSTITLASDTYTSLLAEVDQAIAEKAEGVVPRARKPVAEKPAVVAEE